MPKITDFSSLLSENIWIRIAEDPWGRQIAIPMIMFGSLGKGPEDNDAYFRKLQSYLSGHARYGTPTPRCYPNRLLFGDTDGGRPGESTPGVGEPIKIPDWFQSWADEKGITIRHQRDLTFFPKP